MPNSRIVALNKFEVKLTIKAIELSSGFAAILEANKIITGTIITSQINS